MSCTCTLIYCFIFADFYLNVDSLVVVEFAYKNLKIQM